MFGSSTHCWKDCLKVVIDIQDPFEWAFKIFDDVFVDHSSNKKEKYCLRIPSAYKTIRETSSKLEEYLKDRSSSSTYHKDDNPFRQHHEREVENIVNLLILVKEIVNVNVELLTETHPQNQEGLLKNPPKNYLYIYIVNIKTFKLLVEYII